MNEACYYRVSVKGIAIDKAGRFLLAREDSDMWELLGGGLDHGEDPIAGLKREINEETGLVVTYISPSPRYLITTKRLNHETFIANVIYEVTLKDLRFVPSEECQELRFFTVDEARREKLFPNVEKFLEVYDPDLHV
jgi:8-oxo-dGTP pyrophosphatase MutT (NUDIX family)